jgi:TPR repeat protein
VKWYRKAADQGDEGAQWKLGLMYAGGQGVDKDQAEAVKWYRKAAEQGGETAQWKLGRMYAGGQGVDKDQAEAVTDHFKTSQPGSNQNRPLRGVQFISGFLMQARGFSMI